MFNFRKCSRPLIAISAISGAALSQQPTRMERDPFSCEDPVCRSKIDLFRNAMNMKKEKSLEPACGMGYVTDKILSKVFPNVHMFDHCPQSIEHCKKKFKD